MTAYSSFRSVTFNDNVGAKIALSGDFTLVPTNAGDTTWTITTGSQDVDYNGVLALGDSQAFDVGEGRKLWFLPNGYLNGNYTQRLTKKGAGTLIFTFYQNNIAGFDVLGGVVRISLRHHFGGGNPNPAWSPTMTTLSNGGTVIATADMNLAGVSKCFTLGTGGGKLGADDGMTLQIGNIANQITGAGALGIVGAGQVQLERANDFTGATTVESGTLRLTHVNAVAASPKLTVQSGATLDVAAIAFAVPAAQTLAGAGSVVGNASVAGGLEPGPGLTFAGNLTLGSGATTSIAVTGWGAGQHGQARGDGNSRSVGFGGTLVVTFDGTPAPGSATLFDFNSYSGDFTDVQFVPADASASFDPANGVLTVIPRGTVISVR